MKKGALILLAVAASTAWGQMAQNVTFVAPNRPSVNPITGGGLVPAQSAAQYTVASEREDNESLRQQVKELLLRVEQLEQQKASLEAKESSAPDVTIFVTKDELKLSEKRTQDAIAAESKRVESVILEEIKAAKKAAAPAPVAEASSTPVAKPAPAKLVVSAGEKESYLKEGVRHTVQPGDTLSSIAKKYKSSVRALMVANDITEPNKLYVGRELFVPTL